jgi:hypothetical protein
MNLNTLRRAAMGAGTLVLLGALTVVNASAAIRDHGKRMPEKPISIGLMGKVCIDDVLRIDVDGDAALSGRYCVDPRGGIDYPFVGRLTVSGLKPTAVAKLIADGLKKALTSAPKVSVDIETDQKAAK